MVVLYQEAEDERRPTFTGPKFAFNKIRRITHKYRYKVDIPNLSNCTKISGDYEEGEQINEIMFVHKARKY